MAQGNTYFHPRDNADYTLRDDDTVEVRERDTGKSGVFVVGGAWVAGELKTADIHFIRFIYDRRVPPDALSPGMRRST
jgi:hypothetical protein